MIAFTYPGQGSQEPAMGVAWRDHLSWEVVAEISEAADRDVAHLLLDSNAEELRQTRNSQLASFSMSMVILDAVNQVGIVADAHAGHSLGEFSALAASGVLSLSDAAQLVAERGDATQIASEARIGTMAAVLGLEDEEVEDLCQKVNQVWVANYNAPGQVVIAGSEEGISAATELARERGAKKVMPLKVSGAFHTPFMESAEERLGKALEQVEFRHPESPIYANVDGQPYDRSAPWQDLIVAQLTSPVLWRATLEQMLKDGYKTIVELGAGKALTGMARRIKGADFRLISINLPDDIDILLEAQGMPPADIDHGERLYATERLIVSPRNGVFKPFPELKDGNQIKVGDVIGNVSDEEVFSPFTGTFIGFMAVDDERVNTNQPLAWLRAAEN